MAEYNRRETVMSTKTETVLDIVKRLAGPKPEPKEGPGAWVLVCGKHHSPPHLCCVGDNTLEWVWDDQVPAERLRSRADLEREVIVAAIAYVKWNDDAHGAREAFDQDRTPENLRRVNALEDSYTRVLERLEEAVYALEDHHD